MLRPRTPNVNKPRADEDAGFATISRRCWTAEEESRHKPATTWVTPVTKTNKLKKKATAAEAQTKEAKEAQTGAAAEAQTKKAKEAQTVGSPSPKQHRPLHCSKQGKHRCIHK